MSLPTSDDQDRSACVLSLEMQAFIVVDMQLCVWGKSHTVFQLVTQQTCNKNDVQCELHLDVDDVASGDVCVDLASFHCFALSSFLLIR